MNFTISISPEDVEKLPDFTATGRTIDRFAYAVDTWTEDDLYENNAECEHNNINYVFENYNYENGLLNYLNKIKTASKASAILKLPLENAYLNNKKSKLLFGAYLALKEPSLFNDALDAYTDKVKEYTGGDFDDETLKELAPELPEELEDAQKYFWQQLKKEWLYGDYHGNEGILSIIRKAFNADNVEYTEKTDTICFDFSAETLLDTEYYYDEPQPEITPKLIKNLIADKLINKTNGRHAEDERKRQERKAEHEKLVAYKAEQVQEDIKRREAKLLKMTKTSKKRVN